MEQTASPGDLAISALARLAQRLTHLVEVDHRVRRCRVIDFADDGGVLLCIELQRGTDPMPCRVIARELEFALASVSRYPGVNPEVSVIAYGMVVLSLLVQGGLLLPVADILGLHHAARREATRSRTGRLANRRARGCLAQRKHEAALFSWHICYLTSGTSNSYDRALAHDAARRAASQQRSRPDLRRLPAIIRSASNSWAAIRICSASRPLTSRPASS